MICCVQAPSQLPCAQIAKLEGWRLPYHTEEILALASDPLPFNCVENVVAPSIFSSDFCFLRSFAID